MSNNIVVVKFGGATVGDVEKLKLAAGEVKRLRDDGNKVVVVMSAQADTTDDLLAEARKINEKASGSALDALVQTGEIKAGAFLALALENIGTSAMFLFSHQVGIRAGGQYGEARLLTIERPREITDALEEGTIVILPGFQGMTETGYVATLGRGGSDLTAVAIAAAIGAKRVIFYKDVDGVYSTDPRVVPNAKRLDRITAQRMLVLAELGAQVLMDRSLIVAMAHGIELHVRRSPSIGESTGGTLIVPGSSLENLEGDLAIAFTALTFQKGLACVSVRKVPDRPGSLERIDGMIKQFVVVAQIQDQGKDGIATVVYLIKQDDLAAIIDILRQDAELVVEGEEGLVGLTLIDPRMREGRGYLARRSKALAQVGVNVQMVVTGSNSITTVVKQDNLEKAANALAAEFDLTTE